MTEEINVLYIEDDKMFAELFRDYLTEQYEHIKTVTVEDAEVAYDKLVKDDIDYDVIVSDYNLPGMNGLDLLKRVRSEGKEHPFILFTGKGSEEVASELISAGGDDYLQKEGGLDQFHVLAHRIENYAEQTRAEAHINRQKHLLEVTLEQIPFGIIIEDSNRNIIFANNKIIELLPDYDNTQELVGGSCADLAEEINYLFEEDISEFSNNCIEGGENDEQVFRYVEEDNDITVEYIKYELPIDNYDVNMWLVKE